jgi:hypothetical protein
MVDFMVDLAMDLATGWQSLMCFARFVRWDVY